MAYDVTEVRNKYKTLFETSLDLIYVHDFNGNFLDANDIALNTLGYKKEDIPNLSLKDLVDKDQMVTALNTSEEIKSQGRQSKKNEYKLKKKDGNFIYVETYGIPLKKNGEFYGILDFARNITEIKNIERSLKESEEKYSILFEKSPFGIGLVDMKGKIIDVNNFHVTIGGYKKTDFIGKNFKDLSIYPEKHFPAVMKSFTSLMKNGFSEPVEIQLYKKDGGLAWAYLQTSLIKLKNETFIQIITQDISAIKESEEKYRHLFETSPFSIMLLDLEGIIKDCNPSNEKLYGFKKDEFLGKNFFELLPLIKATELQPFFQDRFKKVFAGETTDPIEIPSYNKDNLLVWVNLQTSLIKLGEKKFVQVILQDISEKKNIEKQLKKLNRELEYKVIERTKELEKSETKFRQIFESIPDLFFLVDEKSAIIDYRGKREEFYVPPEEFLGNKLVDILPFELGKTTQELISKTVSSKQPQILEYNLPLREETYYYEARLLLFSEKRVAIFIRDITERKIAEIKLKESEENYKTLVKTSPDAITAADLKGNITELSERTAEIHGFSDPNELLGKNTFDLIAPESRKIALDTLKKTITVGTVRNVEGIFLKKDGTKFIGEISSSLIKDVHGNPKAIVGITRDISDRKEAEAELKKSEEKYSNLFHHSNDGIFLHDLDGNIIDVNLKVLYQFGYSKPEIFSLKIGDLHPAESHEKSRRAFQEISQYGFVNFEINFKKKNGEIFPADVSSSLFEIGGNKVIQGIVRDITERKEAEQKLKVSEEKLRKQNIELKRLDELKNDFITIAAHELKTPMVSIKGYTDYILTHYKDLDFEIRKDLSLIERNSNRLNMLIDQLLDVMKIDAKKMDIIREEKNIFELIQNCVDELSFLIKEKKMKIILDIQKDLHLSVDPNRIFEVFSNLLSNAIKYTSIEGKIEISARKVNNQYLFKVKDEGKGLSIGEIRRLFKKFEVISKEKTDVFYRKKGLGLGLYISKGVVEAHGGKIWGTSKGRGKGAEFYFTLPILEP